LRYRLAYTQTAVKDIGRLDANVKKRIGNTLLRFIDNPLQYAEPLTDSVLGGYRVIFDIEGNDVVILRVGH
jgi:mRNA interferase RelE/StbE